jgi:hypothetical protein
MVEILFKNTPIKVEDDWRKLNGGLEFFESITQSVSFNNLDEMLEDFIMSLASYYSEKIEIAGLLDRVLIAELQDKFQKNTSRYGVVLNEGVL